MARFPNSPFLLVLYANFLIGECCEVHVLQCWCSKATLACIVP